MASPELLRVPTRLRAAHPGVPQFPVLLPSTRKAFTETGRVVALPAHPILAVIAGFHANVLGPREEGQVLGVDAPFVGAHVMHIEALPGGSVGEFVSDSVSEDHRPVDVDPAVPGRQSRRLPRPALIRSLLVHLVPKLLHDWEFTCG